LESKYCCGLIDAKHFAIQRAQQIQSTPEKLKRKITKWRQLTQKLFGNPQTNLFNFITFRPQKNNFFRAFPQIAVASSCSLILFT